MQKSTKLWRKSFILYYALSAVVVAITAGLAIYSNYAPEFVARLTFGLDAELALFLVPVTLLILAVIAEVLASGARDPEARASAKRPLRDWHGHPDEDRRAA